MYIDFSSIEMFEIADRPVKKKTHRGGMNNVTIRIIYLIRTTPLLFSHFCIKIVL